MAVDPRALTLHVNGYQLWTWTSVSVTRSIEDAVSTFDLSLGEWPGDDVRARPGDECKVYLGSSLAITGYVDEVTESHSGTDHSIAVAGRSKTADIVDCSIITEPATFRNRTLPDIATVLCAPYGVTVVDEVGLDDAIPRFKTEVGQTPWAAVEKLARDQQVLVTDNEHGELVLTRRGEQELPDLRHPGNILSARLSADISNRYSEYRIKSQSVGSDENYGTTVAGIEALDEDTEVPRQRVLVLKAERGMSKEAAKKRAIWEAATRAGKSAQVEVSVQGWRASDGGLWVPNALSRVRDPVIRVDAQLLTVSVTYSLDDGGSRTSITLAPPGAYEPEPVKTRKVTKGIGAWAELRGGV